jgi:hypothetical protein
MSKIQKTSILFLIAIASSLIGPVIGKWYFQQTGIQPITFYVISAWWNRYDYNRWGEDLNI